MKKVNFQGLEGAIDNRFLQAVGAKTDHRVCAVCGEDILACDQKTSFPITIHKKYTRLHCHRKCYEFAAHVGIDFKKYEGDYSRKEVENWHYRNRLARGDAFDD